MNICQKKPQKGQDVPNQFKSNIAFRLQLVTPNLHHLYVSY